MSVEEFASILNETGLPVTYYAYPEGKVPELPYIVYWIPSDADYYADDMNYVNIKEIRIELYSEEKDFDLETKVENVLKSNGIPYGRQETYIKSEKMWMVLYSVSILNTEI